MSLVHAVGESPERRSSICTAIAIAALFKLTGLEGSIPGRPRPAPKAVDDIVSRFEEFMSQTSAGAAEPDELSDYCPRLPVPRQVADIGLEYNLFTEVNGHLVPTAGTGPRFVRGGCALAAAQAMAAR